MTTYVLLTNFGSGAQFFDKNGDPLTGGKLYSYDAGTTTPANTWTSHLGNTFNANPIILDAEGRVPEQIWIDLDKSYKFTLKDATDVEIWTKDYNGFYTPAPYVPPPIVPQFITLWDFLSPAQIADVKARAFTLDVSNEFQAAINYAGSFATTKSTTPLTTLIVPAGGYRIEQTLLVPKPIVIRGAGQGGNESQAPTDIKWYGGTSDIAMIWFGMPGSALPFDGGGILALSLDGRRIATRILLIRNCRLFEFRDLYLKYSTYAAMELTNPADQPFPSGLGLFRNIYIDQYADFSNNTNRNGTGIFLNAQVNPDPDLIRAEGFPACSWDAIFIAHTDGAAIQIAGGDNHQWGRVLAFRSGEQKPPLFPVPEGVGNGLWFSGIWDGITSQNTMSAHLFLNPAFGGGIRVDDPSGINDAQYLVNNNDGDVPLTTQPITGRGIGRVNGTSHSGRLFGSLKTLSYRDTIHHDMMSFMEWTAPILRTTHGSWGTSAGTVSDGLQVGGAVNYQTTTANGNIAAIYNCKTLGFNGLGGGQNPHLIFTVSTVSVFDCIHRFGFMDSIANPPQNGCWVEVNQTAFANFYRCISAKAGVQTVIAKNIVSFSANATRQFRIELINDAVAFYGRAPGSRFYEFMGQITTNIPTANMDCVFQTVNTDTVANVKQVYVLDFKLGFLNEF